MLCVLCVVLFFQAEDGIRDLVRSRGLGDVYKRQPQSVVAADSAGWQDILSVAARETRRWLERSGALIS